MKEPKNNTEKGKESQTQQDCGGDLAVNAALKCLNG